MIVDCLYFHAIKMDGEGEHMRASMARVVADKIEGGLGLSVIDYSETEQANVSHIEPIDDTDPKIAA